MHEILFVDVPAAAAKKHKKKNAPVESDITTDATDGQGQGWINCKGRSRHHVKKYGNPMFMIGRTFTVVEKYSDNFPFEIVQGVIESVVRRFGSTDSEHFKFYDLSKYPQGPPSLGSKDWLYYSCRNMMSTDKKKTGFKWDAVHNTSRTTKQKPKKRKVTHEWTYEKPTGLFDRDNSDDSLT